MGHAVNDVLTSPPRLCSEARRQSHRRASGFLWVVPAVIVFGILYAVPLAQMIYRSLGESGLTFEHYAYVLSEEVYYLVFKITFQVGALVTFSCLLIGYPIAYVLSRLHGRWLLIALAFVLLPFWTSVLVRNYAWIVLLSRRGLVNTLLLDLGLIETPLLLMFNVVGVVIGMTYVLVPFMILSLYAVMQGIDPHLLRASASLGAPPRYTFWRVFFPLSLPGVWAGCLLVFIMAIGFFITPALLGGGRVPMIATLIESQVRGVLNWGVGSALGTLLLLAVLAVYYVFDRVLGVEYLFGSRP